MNTIKRLFTKIFSKMDNKIERANLLILAYQHYQFFDEKTMPADDKARMDALVVEIDKAVDEFLPKREKKEPEVKDKSKETPASSSKPTETAKPAGGKVEIPKEALVMVKPYYDCQVETKKGQPAKSIKFEDARLELPAFLDAKTAKQYNDVYPTVDNLESILDKAWDMCSKGMSNKDAGEFLQKSLGSFYGSNGLKTDQDYYKITNPYSKLAKILRKAFGEGYEDYKVTVSRPSYSLIVLSDKGEIVMTKENDCTVPAEAKKPEEKPAMKTVQEQKAAPKGNAPETKKPEAAKLETAKAETAALADEEVQETGNAPEEEVSTSKETVTEPVEETTEDKAPAVNDFESFNDIETLVFETIKAGNAKAAKEKDPAKQKVIKAEAIADAKLNIQSRFDGESWVEKDENGYWKKEFLNYWNAITKAIGQHANVK
jgi:hypothetical protein